MHRRVVIVGLVMLIVSWSSIAAVAILLQAPAQAAFRAQCQPPAPQDEEACAAMERSLALMSQALIEIGLLGTIAAIILLIGLALGEPVPRLAPPVAGAEADPVVQAWQGRRIPRHVQIVAYGIAIALVAAILWNVLIWAISLGTYGVLLGLSWRRLTPRRLDVSCLFSLGLAMFLLGYVIAGILGVLVAMNLFAIVAGLGYALASGQF